MHKLFSVVGVVAVVVMVVTVLVVGNTDQAIADGGDDLEFEANLAGAQEVPPKVTDTTGEVEVEFDEDLTEMEFELKVFDGVDVVAAHIHCAPGGTNGPVGITLFSGGPVDVDGTLAEGTVTSPNAGNRCGWSTLADAAAAAKSGDTYVNVHTLVNRPGEVRGQLLLDLEFEADLDGDQEVPPKVTDTTGEAEVEFSDDLAEMEFELEVSDGVDVIAAHIHCAPAGSNGPVGVTLFSGGPVDVDGTLAEGTVTAPNAGNGCGWSNLAAVASAAQSGDAYVNVHTLANKPGEVRGQLMGD